LIGHDSLPCECPKYSTDKGPLSRPARSGAAQTPHFSLIEGFVGEIVVVEGGERCVFGHFILQTGSISQANGKLRTTARAARAIRRYQGPLRRRIVSIVRFMAVRFMLLPLDD
jgi:hypothetical protein